MVSGKEKSKLGALKETKRALKGTVFQYITIKYICSKYPGTYLVIPCLFLKKDLKKHI